MSNINRTVLMSGPEFFDDQSPINPYMDNRVPVNSKQAQVEHDRIRTAFEEAGITVVQVPPPVNCQDGVYTANWALVRGDTAVLSHLPNARETEEDYAAQVLRGLGKTVLKIPHGWRFSGQGDALPCGNLLFCGQGYRSDAQAQAFAAKTLGYELVQLQTVPLLGADNKPTTNLSSGWLDSFFYDIDLALAVITPQLIAWCPEAFAPESQATLRALDGVKKIEVSLVEAMQGFACNLVSTGETVVMSGQAPQLRSELTAHGFKVIAPAVQELLKGGGFIRCVSLTL